MPRPKRLVRAHGVAQSLGAARGMLFQCVGGCDRVLPRDAIAYLGRHQLRQGKYQGHYEAYCGECWRRPGLQTRRVQLSAQPSAFGRRWSDQEILDAIQRWAKEHDGVPPTWTDWARATNDHPTSVTVAKRCGGWRDALEMSGFDREVHLAESSEDSKRKFGNKKKFSRKQAQALRDQGMTNADIARHLDTNTRTITRVLGPQQRKLRKPRTAAQRRADRIAALGKALAKQESDGGKDLDAVALGRKGG